MLVDLPFVIKDSECLLSLLVKDNEWTLPSKDSNPFVAPLPCMHYLSFELPSFAIVD